MDAQIQVEDMGYINVGIGDLSEVEDGDFRKLPPPKVSSDLDNPYAMVLETQRQPSSSTALPTHQPRITGEMLSVMTKM